MSARAQVLGHARLEQRDAGRVEVRDRLIENPQRRSRQQDAARWRRAASAPPTARAPAGRRTLRSAAAASVSSSSCCRHCRRSADAVVQILERGEIRLERIDVSEVRELLVKVVATLVAAGCPRQTISPDSIGSRPATQRSRLVLPTPFGPTTCSSSPRCRTNDTPRSRCRSPRHRWTARTSSCGSRCEPLRPVHACSCRDRLENRRGVYQTPAADLLSPPASSPRPYSPGPQLAAPRGLQFAPAPAARVAKLVDARDLRKLSTRLGNGRREWGQIRGTSTAARA